MKPFQDCTLIYGGSFDPPHIGHLEAVVGLFSEPGAKRVVIMPSGHSPLKATKTDALHRLQMTKIQFEEGPFRALDVSVDDREVTKSLEKGVQTPTFETLQEIRALTSNDLIAFVLGTDQLLQLEQWQQFPNLLKLSHWIVLIRKPHTQAMAIDKLKTWELGGLVKHEKSNDSHSIFKVCGSEKLIGIFFTNARNISSSEIRAHFAREGSAPDGALLPEITSYLKLNGLYGTR